MKRQFNPSRLYKLSRIIVIIVTPISLGMGGLLWNNHDNFVINNLDKFGKCSQEVSGNGISAMSVCGFYIDSNIEYEEDMNNYLKVGFILPIVFFGGAALARYLFPKKSP